MTPADGLPPDQMEATEETAFVESVCLPFLRSAQNGDGGWGFHPGSQSRVEPTCWALLALTKSELSAGAGEILRDGFGFLHASQLPDGSWPSSPEEKIGCWVTSLACWALLSEKDSCKALAAGLNWLCEDWPRDGSLWRRLLRRFSSERHISPKNLSYRGWGWTPRTSSWVEPTSFALIVLGESPRESLPPAAKRRRQVAEAMLYDRMCPGGGWNCGNPMVYGVPGNPLVIPTAWALFALRDHANQPANAISLNWLEENLASVQGPGSLALARICLEAYGRRWPMVGSGLQDFYRRNEFLQSIPVAAWTCLACRTKSRWLTGASREMS